jgi:hypothetical protein
MIDYAKSKEWMMWIHPWQNECQRSVNNCGSCISGDLHSDRLQIVINEVLAAFIGKSYSRTLTAPSWKWASTACR